MVLKHKSHTGARAGVAGEGTASPLLVPRRRRRKSVLLLGVLLCLVGGLTGAWVASNVTDTVAVLAVARPVAYGEQIKPADVRVVRIAPDRSVSVVSASRRGQVVGRYAATDLYPGGLFSRASVTTARVPGLGQQLVGVALPKERMPRRPLSGGDRVVVVTTPPEEAEPSDEEPDGVKATVVSVGPRDDNGVRVVDLRVPAGAGAGLAARAATGRIALVLESPGG